MIDTRLIDRPIDLKGLLFTIGGGLGKRKMLWELNPPGECFRSILGFPEIFTSVSIILEKTSRKCIFLSESTARK